VDGLLDAVMKPVMASLVERMAFEFPSNDECAQQSMRRVLRNEGNDADVFTVLRSGFSSSGSSSVAVKDIEKFFMPLVTRNS